MKHYKKTLIGSIITFILSTSCCWLSSLAIWLGGLASIGAIVEFIEGVQLQLILTGSVLGIISLYLYFRNKRKKPAENRVGRGD